MLHYAAPDGPPSKDFFGWLGGSFFTFPYKDKTRTVHLKSVLFRSKGIIGQGTIVVRVECNYDHCDGHCEWYVKKLMLKLSFPSKTRVSEQTFMDRCKALAQGDHAWVLNHLPHTYWSFDVYFQANTPNADLKERFKDDYEILETAKDCAQVFYDVVQCHHWAWKYPKILHRDISQGNIMVREKDGEKYGVLNDWDLSSWINEQRDGPTSKFRTGTKPYMAHEQHSYGWQGPHRFRHDLESLFYVILLLACLYPSTSAKYTAPMSFAQDFEYEEWHMQNDSFLVSKKYLVLYARKWTPPVLPFFLGFTVWLINLQRALGYGFFALREHWDFLRLDKQFKSDNQDTLDNHFSYETVVSIMHRFREEELKTRGSEWQKIPLRSQPI
ncbi:protein kinase [Lentinula aciculospora]|uniref:Protein kinase n=1 Tax=Lentinula aciculospora TaxID=153920 RepID=A0A9W8ZY13_9AGAR|nr:protein kinase [Lentinula aciculospora]